MSAEPVIRLEAVGKTYVAEGIETPVLFDVSLQVYPGEFVSIIGASGSGKTTLLNLMGLLDSVTTGGIWIEGRPVAHLDEPARATLRRDRLGFIFQFHYLLPEFNVLENALMPCRLRGRRFEAQQRERMAGLLAQVGLGDRLDTRATRLSGGQQQRVAVVRALANDPALVFADEPTGNLDSKSGHLVFELMRGLARETGKAFVMVTHDEHFAALADRTIHLQDGRIVPA
jgi:lipoprotein-releasing system ATP-binding protein